MPCFGSIVPCLAVTLKIHIGVYLHSATRKCWNWNIPVHMAVCFLIISIKIAHEGLNALTAAFILTMGTLRRLVIGDRIQFCRHILLNINECIKLATCHSEFWHGRGERVWFTIGCFHRMFALIQLHEFFITQIEGHKLCTNSSVCGNYGLSRSLIQL